MARGQLAPLGLAAGPIRGALGKGVQLLGAWQLLLFLAMSL